MFRNRNIFLVVCFSTCQRRLSPVLAGLSQRFLSEQLFLAAINISRRWTKQNCRSFLSLRFIIFLHWLFCASITILASVNIEGNVLEKISGHDCGFGDLSRPGNRSFCVIYHTVWIWISKTVTSRRRVARNIKEEKEEERLDFRKIFLPS